MSQQDQAQRIVEGTLWADFCDSLKQAGEQVLRETRPGDVFNRAAITTRVVKFGDL